MLTSSTVMHHTYDTMAGSPILLKVSGVMHMTWGRIDPVATVDLSTPSHATDAPSVPHVMRERLRASVAHS